MLPWGKWFDDMYSVSGFYYIYTYHVVHVAHINKVEFKPILH